jgi:hypothetical protein
VQEIVLMPTDITRTLYVRASVYKAEPVPRTPIPGIRFRAVEPIPFSAKGLAQKSDGRLCSRTLLFRICFRERGTYFIG